MLAELMLAAVLAQSPPRPVHYIAAQKRAARINRMYWRKVFPPHRGLWYRIRQRGYSIRVDIRR